MTPADLYGATDAPLRRAVTRGLAEIARDAHYATCWDCGGRNMRTRIVCEHCALEEWVDYPHGTQSAKDWPPAGSDDQATAEGLSHG